MRDMACQRGILVVAGGASVASHSSCVRTSSTATLPLSSIGTPNLFKALRLFDPRRAFELNSTTNDIDTVFVELPALARNIDVADREAMKADLPKYLSLGADFVRPRCLFL
eukprot:COSAG02_NODE_1808_length_10843_cov_4.345867_3_plen_111_part_00